MRRIEQSRGKSLFVRHGAVLFGIVFLKLQRPFALVIVNLDLSPSLATFLKTDIVE
jgi:hypothetical protein